MPPSVFLSHSSRDRFFARKLAEKLQVQGISVSIDEAELKVGDSLVEKISSAIDRTDFVAAILSPNSIRSGWVQKELKLAMTKEIQGRAVRVLPILIEACDLPEFLRDKLYADFTDPKDFDGPFERLLNALGVSKPTAAATAVSEATPSQPGARRPRAEPTPPPSAHGGQRNLEGFVDLKIIGIDKSRLYRPDLQNELYHIHFELSDHPPQEWVQIFEAERQFPRHTMWRHAWIDGKYVVVHCVPDEVKKYHLLDITEDVKNSNLKYRDYLHRVAEARARETQREAKVNAELNKALDDLTFER